MQADCADFRTENQYHQTLRMQTGGMWALGGFGFGLNLRAPGRRVRPSA
jgi:hypothetical protein